MASLYMFGQLFVIVHATFLRLYGNILEILQ